MSETTSRQEAPKDIDPTGDPVMELLIERIAREVWHGKWGCNVERKKRLGPFYHAVQKRVKELASEYGGY